MHTFMKAGAGSYQIGNWVRDDGTDVFQTIVTAPTLRAAIRLTNMLNGGNGQIDKTLLRAGVDPEKQDYEKIVARQTAGTAVVQGSRKGHDGDAVRRQAVGEDASPDGA